jgi:hypothetical protein
MTRLARRSPFTSLSITIAAPVGACALFWVAFAASLGACIDHPEPEAPPASKIFAHWDPLACGDEVYRVAIELYDDAGAQLGGSAPCVRGGLTIDVHEWGRYRGRMYAAMPGEPPAGELPLLLDVDMPEIQWDLETPR